MIRIYAYLKHIVLDLNILRDVSNRYFLGFLFFYFILGSLISYQNNVGGNIYFGADNARAYGDLTGILSNHYRIKVHPLFLLFTQPITLLINGICNNPKLAVIIVQSLCAAMFIKIFYQILLFLKVHEIIIKSFPLILGFSFSFIIFSSTPETFIFSGLSSILFFYYLIKNPNLNLDSKKQILTLCVFATFLTGMVVTNYVLFFTGVFLTLLFWNKFNIKVIIKNLGKLFIISLTIIMAMCIIQKFIWNSCPIFISSMLDGLAGKGYEETLYINTNVFSLNQLTSYLYLFFLYPLLSPNIKLYVYDNKWSSSIEFSQYHDWQIVFWSLCLILLFITIFVFIVKILRRNNVKNSFPLILGGVFFLFNFSLHYLYGQLQAFIFSCNYLYLILLCIALMLDNVIDGNGNNNVCITAKVVAFVFTIIEFFNNLYYFNKTRLFTYEWLNTKYHTSPSIKVICFYVIGTLVSLVILDKLKTIRAVFYPDTATSVEKTQCIIRTIIYVFCFCIFWELISISLQDGGIKGFIQSTAAEFHIKVQNPRLN